MTTMYTTAISSTDILLFLHAPRELIKLYYMLNNCKSFKDIAEWGWQPSKSILIFVNSDEGCERVEYTTRATTLTTKNE